MKNIPLKKHDKDVKSKAGKTFGLKEHLQRYLHLPSSKSTSGARTRKESQIVFIKLQAVLVSYYSREQMEIN